MVQQQHQTVSIDSQLVIQNGIMLLVVVFKAFTAGSGLTDSGTATDPDVAIDSACNTKWDQSGCAGINCVGTVVAGDISSFTDCVGTVTSVTGGDGIDSTGGATPEVTVDSTVVRTCGAQSITGVKNFEGNVGLGTTAPTQKLVLSGDTGTNIQVQQNDGGGLFLGSSGGTRFGLGTGSNIIQATTSDFGIGTQGGNSFTIGTDNTNRVHVKSTGEVGIGTTDPEAKLTVAGTLSAQSCVVGEAIVKRGGTASQFLKADGSVDSSSYTTCIGTVVAGDISSFTTCTGTTTPTSTETFTNKSGSNSQWTNDEGYTTCTGTLVAGDISGLTSCVGDVTGIDAGTAITVTDGSTATPQVAVTSACNTAWNNKTTCTGTITTAGALLSGNATTLGVDSGALDYLNQSACAGIDCVGTVVASDLNGLDQSACAGILCTGTVTSVARGNGINGTGNITSSGSIAVGAGTGITVNTNDVALAAACRNALASAYTTTSTLQDVQV